MPQQQQQQCLRDCLSASVCVRVCCRCCCCMRECVVCVFDPVLRRSVRFPDGAVHAFDVTTAPPAILALPFCSKTKTVTLLRVRCCYTYTAARGPLWLQFSCLRLCRLSLLLHAAVSVSAAACRSIVPGPTKVYSLWWRGSSKKSTKTWRSACDGRQRKRLAL